MMKNHTLFTMNFMFKDVIVISIIIFNCIQLFELYFDISISIHELCIALFYEINTLLNIGIEFNISQVILNIHFKFSDGLIQNDAILKDF